VLENRRALPRAYVTHEALVAPPSEALGALSRPEFVPGRTFVLENEAPAALGGADTVRSAVRLVASGTRRIELEVDAVANGILVLIDTYHPGWTARVDGAVTEILAANGMLRGVPVGPGVHRVELSNDPWRFRLGAGLSLLSLLAWPRPVRRRPPPGSADGRRESGSPCESRGSVRPRRDYLARTPSLDWTPSGARALRASSSFMRATSTAR
jgi:hypothetical protein